jgi:hypothetical protein
MGICEHLVRSFLGRLDRVYQKFAGDVTTCVSGMGVRRVPMAKETISPTVLASGVVDW